MIERLGENGFVATGAGVSMVRLVALKSALKLETLGLGRRGRSVYSIVKQEFGLKGNKKAVYEQFCKLVEVKGKEYLDAQSAQV